MRNRPGLVLALSLVLLSPAAPARSLGGSDFEGNGPWMVRAWFGDEAMLRAVASWGDPYRIDRKLGYLSIEAGPERLGELQELGFYVELDAELTRWIRHAERAQLDAVARRERGEAPLAGIPGFPCYRTVDETFARAEALAVAHSGLATWTDAGDSWEKTAGLGGDDLGVLVLTRSATPEPKPRLFVTAAIHAREYATAELALRFAEQLLEGYGVDPDATWLLDEHEIHLLLQTNPDGRRRAETGSPWRKNTNQGYCGATSTNRGADLNRNFTFQWSCCGGSSGDPCSDTYRGPAPGSEPEVQAVEGYLAAHFPDQRGPGLGDAAPSDATGVYLDLHSYGELVIWPWGFTANPAPNGAALTTLGRRFAWINGYFPEQAIGLYPTDGTTDDFGYGELGVAAMTFELGTSFFQSCALFENTIAPANLNALRYAAKVARTPFLTPSGPDATGVAVAPPVVALGDPVDVAAAIDDTRFSTDNGAEPVQPIAAGEAYVDLPPWAPGASPIPLLAVDGVFDGTLEAVAATFDSDGLASGRHTIFLRGRDTSGTWGPVSAAFLWVFDPAVAPIVRGTVRDAVTWQPLAATVAVGPVEVATPSGSGYYSVQVPDGVHALSASAAGYAPESLAGVPLAPNERRVQDFWLAPLVAAFEDDSESGDSGWAAQAPWAITDAVAHSPSHSWTDSPGGSYGNFVDASLTSPAFDLTGARGVELTFWHRYATEATYDFCHVEISADGGATWSEVATFDGNQASWLPVTLSLPQLDGAVAARIRFRLTTDVSITADGWYVDDIRLRAAFASAPQGLIFLDAFESSDTTAWAETTP